MVAVLVVGVTTLGATTAVARSTASTVEFRPVLAELPPESTTSTTMGPADRVDVGVKIAICDVVAVGQLPVVPTTKWRTAKPEECVVYPDLSAGRHSSRKYLGPAAVTTSDVKRARAEFVAGQGWTVKLTLPGWRQSMGHARRAAVPQAGRDHRVGTGRVGAPDPAEQPDVHLLRGRRGDQRGLRSEGGPGAGAPRRTRQRPVTIRETPAIADHAAR
jgi:hypothetical protein